MTRPQPRRKRIGLLGGSFNPPHQAHLALAGLALQALALDEVRWLPAGEPWQKAGQPMASAEHRLAMLAALLQGQAQQVIDPRELRRAGPTYTIDTVRELVAEQPEADWFFILGQDQYADFDRWRDWPELLQHLTLAVAARAGQAPEPPPAVAAVAHRCMRLDLPAIDVSASDIRQRLAAGQTVAALVGPQVAGYIDRHHLYSSPQQQDTAH